MSNILPIFKAVEYIEQHLKSEVSIADVADAVGYSLYHFSRMFNQITQHTPYNYLMRRRLSESTRDLIETNNKIIDIAFDYQFNTPETYSRAFKRMFGMQPKQMRKKRRIDRHRFMNSLTLEYLLHINRGSYLKANLEEKNRVRVAGFATLIKAEKRYAPELWDILLHELTLIKGIPLPQAYYGITFYPHCWEECGVFYMAAIEVPQDIELPSIWVTKTLPASQYATFVHKGSVKNLNLTLAYVYHTWLPKSGKIQAQPTEILHYSRVPNHSGGENAERKLYIPIA